VGRADTEVEEPPKSYIDLWPVRMSVEIAPFGEEPNRRNVLKMNLDTYTLILQLGCMLLCAVLEAHVQTQGLRNRRV
jgi:potassium/chloride transporter 9